MRINDKVKKTALFSAVFFSIYLFSFNCVFAQSLETLDGEISKIIGNVSHSVVTVEARQGEQRVPWYPNHANAQHPVKAVVGSGIIFDSLGYVLTIQSLVDDYDNFQIIIDGHIYNAKLIGVDRRLNLAVLKIPVGKYAPVSFSSFPPLSGRLALAYGRSIGYTGYTSLGVIAGRQNSGNYLMSGAILPGLLGGGVFDLSGNLIGVISSGSISAPGMGDAVWAGIEMIPAGTAITAAKRIIHYGNRDAGYLGVRTTSIELVSDNGHVVSEAVVVADIDPESPAARAGLVTGDIITDFAGQKITNDRQLQQLIATAGADSTIAIAFLRGNRHLSVSLALSAASPKNAIKRTYATKMAGGKKDIWKAYQIQQRIDSMKSDMRRLQRQLNDLIQQYNAAR